ncbi:hypothetical protein TI04_09535 [Achromatium sp. WMS2]|nr:hypothetical protein TI04_09535 [Achromatium sp. WMS2]
MSAGWYGRRAASGFSSGDGVRDQLEQILLVLQLHHLGAADAVAVLPGDGLVTGDAVAEEPREDPAREIVGVDTGDIVIAELCTVVVECLLQEVRAVVERLGVALRALDETLLVLFRGADVEDQRLLCERLHDLRFVEFAKAAAGIVDEMAVAVDLSGLVDEVGNIEHRPHLGIMVQLLPALEFAETDAPAIRVADLAEERGERVQVVKADVVADEDGVAAQQVSQERHLHHLQLDVVANRLVEVVAADPVVAGIVIPFAARQQGRESCLADAGHPEEGNPFCLPGTKGLRGHAHVQSPR